MVKALKNCDTHFDFIGMDCCIMSCLEITYALRDYCDYMIVSEDFESSLGWYYTGWLEALYEDTSISTYDLAKILIDDMVAKNEKDRFNGDRAILALVDESHMDKLWELWTQFAYDCEDKLLSTNYSQQMESSGNRQASTNQPVENCYAFGWFRHQKASNQAKNKCGRQHDPRSAKMFFIRQIGNSQFDQGIHKNQDSCNNSQCTFCFNRIDQQHNSQNQTQCC